MTTAEKVAAYLRNADLLRVRDADCAAAICKSTTTLRRRLRDENTSYGELLWAERKRRADELLARNPHIDQWKLADVMGYTQRNSAGRAFQRLYGMPHLEFRRARV